MHVRDDWPSTANDMRGSREGGREGERERGRNEGRGARTRAASTSAVPKLWPETMTTSSARPVIQ